MIYSFHPEAAAEYAEHVAFYKSLRTELGARFHEAVKTVIASICEMPARHHTDGSAGHSQSKGSGFSFPCYFSRG